MKDRLKKKISLKISQTRKLQSWKCGLGFGSELYRQFGRLYAKAQFSVSRATQGFDY